MCVMLHQLQQQQQQQSGGGCKGSCCSGLSRVQGVLYLASCMSVFGYMGLRQHGLRQHTGRLGETSACEHARLSSSFQVCVVECIWVKSIMGRLVERAFSAVHAQGSSKMWLLYFCRHC
jgi:hypothetical protein